MPGDPLKPALRLALRLHELGTASPYEVCFAGKGRSGASFGFMQGDLAGQQPEVQQTFRDAMLASGMPAATVARLAQQLSVPLTRNPLGADETQQVNAALLARQALVDAMDETILGKVYHHLDTCAAAAESAGRTITPEALLYMAMWINMTGEPSALLIWLGGGDPPLPQPTRRAGKLVDGVAMQDYLRATKYFVEHPDNLAHMVACATQGAKALQPERTGGGEV